MNNYMGCGSQLKKEGLKEKLQELEDSTQYVAEEKLDGQWAEIVIENGKVLTIISRTGKIKPFESLLAYRFNEKVTGIFIGELGYGSSNSKLKEKIAVIYDWIYIEFNGKVLHSSKFCNRERRRILEEVLIDMNPGVELVHRRLYEFWKFYWEVLGQNGEGLIIKKLDGFETVYQAGTRLDSWIKVKKEVEVDMVIMGMNWRKAEGMSTITKDKGMENCIKDIICGQYRDGKLVAETDVGSMTDEARKWFSKNAVESIGNVVTIRGFEQFKNTGAIRHSSLIVKPDGSFIREDLKATDCFFGKIKLL